MGLSGVYNWVSSKPSEKQIIKFRDDAIEGHLVSLMKFVKKYKVNIINKKSVNGNTALILAAREGKIDIARELIAAGADLNVRNNEGNTALSLAACKGHFDIVKDLIAVEGIDIENISNQGNTAIMSAASEVRVQVIELLIEKGANLDIVSNGGETVLSYVENLKHDYLTNLVKGEITKRVMTILEEEKTTNDTHDAGAGIKKSITCNKPMDFKSVRSKS